jgi:hypothetical protein
VTSIGERAFYDCLSLAAMYFQGNAPGVASESFLNANTTVYYVPGTSGWETTFGTRPTVLWNPQVQTCDGTFGAGANGFGFTVSGARNLAVVVEACSDPAHPAWVPLQTNIPAGDSFYFSDPGWTDYPVRFYHLHWP